MLAIGAAPAAANETISDQGSPQVGGLNKAERKALDIKSVTVEGGADSALLVTVTFKGNFERRIGRGHMPGGLAALLLLPESSKADPGVLLTYGPGLVGQTLRSSISRRSSVIREGRRITFVMPASELDGVAGIYAASVARTPTKRARSAQGDGAGNRALDEALDELLPPGPDFSLPKGKPADATTVETAAANATTCAELTAVRDRIEAALAELRAEETRLDKLIQDIARREGRLDQLSQGVLARILRSVEFFTGEITADSVRESLREARLELTSQRRGVRRSIASLERLDATVEVRQKAACEQPAGKPLGMIERFTVPTADANLQGIAAAAQAGVPGRATAAGAASGFLWFTEVNGDKVGRIDTAGSLTEFPLPASGRSGRENEPSEIALGPDGAMWFTQSGDDQIGRIAADGTVTEFDVPTDFSFPYGITAGPDGAMWFTERIAGKVGRITTAGQVTEFPLPGGASADPYWITTGPDGNLWVSEFTPSKIARITPTGTITEFSVPGTPAGITTGPDGNLWFAQYNGNGIARMTTAGQVTGTFAIPTQNSQPTVVAAGPDGALWFTEFAGTKIGRSTTDGAVTEFALPANSGPNGIVAGPDGQMWFTMITGNEIGSIGTGE